MDKQQAITMAKELRNAVATIMAKHGFTDVLILESVSLGGNVCINVATPEAIESAMPSGAPGTVMTPNAVKRYQKRRVELNLPALGTAIDWNGQQYTVAGLSSDGKRVKATLGTDKDTAHDLPLGDVRWAVAFSAAAKLAQVESNDAVQSTVEADALIAKLKSQG